MSKDFATFILGGAGFVGSRLIKRLDIKNKKYFVGDINDSSEKTIKLDIEDLDSLDHITGCDCIVNLAAVHRDDIRPLSRYDDVNVQGSTNICEAARKHGINKIIFTSSVAIYGFAPADTNESGKPNYFNDYFNYDVISKFSFLDHKLILEIWRDIKIKKDYSNLYGMWALFTFIQWQTNLDK